MDCIDSMLSKFQSLFLWKVIVEIIKLFLAQKLTGFQSLFLWKVIVEPARPRRQARLIFVSILVFMEGHRRVYCHD